MRADVAMFLFRQGVHRIFGKHLLVAMLIGLTSRGIDPETDSNAAQDDGLDLSATQLQVQVGAKEGTPLVLGDQVIQGLRSQFWRKLGEHLLWIGWGNERTPLVISITTKAVLAGCNVKDAIT